MLVTAIPPLAGEAGCWTKRTSKDLKGLCFVNFKLSYLKKTILLISICLVAVALQAQKWNELNDEQKLNEGKRAPGR